MIYALAICIAITASCSVVLVFHLLTHKDTPDAIVMGQQLLSLKLSVTDLSERLDALYRKDRTNAARAAKETKAPEPDVITIAGKLTKAQLREQFKNYQRRTEQ